MNHISYVIILVCKFFPQICKNQYREIAEFLIPMTNRLWAQVQGVVQQIYTNASNPTLLKPLLVQRKAFEDQLAWMTYIASALVVRCVQAFVIITFFLIITL